MLKSLQRILLLLSLILALPALAQSDPPARVGRLAYVENQVDFRVDRNEQPGPASLNWPISSGAVLETGQRGRAEVWIGSTAYRLADDSQVEFPVVNDNRVDVRLTGGSLAVSILDRDQVDDVIVATPEGNIRFLTPGRYRIDVMGDHSELTVQAGRAVFDNGQREIPVSAGQKLSRWGDGGDQLGSDRASDSFDRWVSARENATLAGPSRRLVSPRMTGYQDLDAYGDWQTAPDYGAVWYPRAVADDWAPYRYGRWAWVNPWGWTWIDQAPWGFAPFHYGRWAIINGRWAWIPGRIVPRPVYAPALVAWIGNPGWNVSFGFGAAPAVGWFPLAPREVYVPAHRYSPNYVRQVNVAYVRDVSVIDRALRPGGQADYAHHALPRAVTVVPANLMREGRTITAREIRQSDRPDLARAPVARLAPNAEWLAPTQGAVRPHSDERREPINAARRDFNAPRSESMQRSPDRPSFRQSAPDSGNAREAWRGSPEIRSGSESRVRPAEIAPVPLPQRREAVPPDVRQPAAEAAQSQQFDGRRGDFRRLPEGAPMRREMPAPDARTEERQVRPMMPVPEREQRRDMQRMERPAPVETPRQPEMSRPAPEARMPAAPQVREMPQQPRAEPPRQMQEFRAPAPAPMPQQRVEPPRPPVQEFRAPPTPAPAPPPQPRMEPPRQPAPQGGGQGDPRRHHDDDRGGR